MSDPDSLRRDTDRDSRRDDSDDALEVATASLPELARAIAEAHHEDAAPPLRPATPETLEAEARDEMAQVQRAQETWRRVEQHVNSAPEDFRCPRSGLRAAGAFADDTADVADILGEAFGPDSLGARLLGAEDARTFGDITRGVTAGAHVASDLLDAAATFFPSCGGREAPQEARAVAAADAEEEHPLTEVNVTLDVTDVEVSWVVLRMRAVEALDEPTEASIDLLADDELPFDRMPGHGACLRFGRDGEASRRAILGVVTRVVDLGHQDGRRAARVHVAASLWLLSLRQGCRIFQDVDLREIVEAVLRDAAVYPLASQRRWAIPSERAYARREYCVQYRESDLDFVGRLLQEEGVSFATDVDDDGNERVTFYDGLSAAQELSGRAARGLSLRGAEAATANAESLARFEAVFRIPGRCVTLRDYNFTMPEALPALTHARPAVGRREHEVYDPVGRYTFSERALDPRTDHDFAWRSDDGARRAEVRAQELRSDERTGIGEGNVLRFTPARRFTLRAPERDDVDGGAFVLTRVEHAYDGRDALRSQAGERAADGEGYRNTFECVPAACAWRPRRVTRRPAIDGVQTATVVGPEAHKDDPSQREDIYTDVHGRVKVRFHWDRRPGVGEGRAGASAGVRDEHRSCWIRVAQLWAGGAVGSMFVPRRGMEVVVTFEEGDPDRPLIVGCVYNGTHRPHYPLEEAAHATCSWIGSQSTPGDDPDRRNELGFRDRRGHELLWVHAQRDHRVVVGHEHCTTVHGAQRLAVYGARKHRVDRDEDIDVGGDQWLRVLGAQNVSVQGVQDITVHNDAGLYVTGRYGVRSASAVLLAVGDSSQPPQVSVAAAGVTLQQGPLASVAVEAEKITLMCGPSSIVMTPAGIVLKNVISLG